MGLIRAALNSAGGVMADQWKEYFYCESMPETVLAVKGKKRTDNRSSNTKGSDNIISNGSVIAVADGQCMMIVEQGKVVEVCAEPGEFIFDSGMEPSIFSGGLDNDSIMNVLKTVGKRFTFGGQVANDQRVYYFNTKELIGNKYGTPSPVPFRVVDERAGLDMDITIRCFGEYSYRITNPLLFYTNVCGNVSEGYTRDIIEGQLKSELLTALQPAFARISEMGIRYSALPGHTMELAAALNDVLSSKWKDLRGLEIVSFGVSSVKANEEDERAIKELQKNAAYLDPTRAAATLVGAQADAMRSAASNTSAGPAMAFMGMNMAGGIGGGNAQNLYSMGQQMTQTPPVQNENAFAMQPQNARETWICPTCKNETSGKFCPECGTRKPEGNIADSWTCPNCKATASGKFCPECGARKPEGWTCPKCGILNQGKFCQECGTRKPSGTPQYRCDKCGWVPENPSNPPRFCPECGDPFGDEDIV